MPTSPPDVRKPPLRDERGRRRAYGFTLIEILFVIIIIGVIVSAATIAVGVLGRDREAKEEAQRFWAVLRQAREEAELQSLDIAVFVAANAYEYLHFEPRMNAWVPLAGDRLYVPRELPDGLRFRVWLDGREIVLAPRLPDRGEPSENFKFPPQVIVLSSGEVMPFELHIERDAAPALFRVVALPDNDLRIEQRTDDRQWSVLAQTRPPADEEVARSGRERLSHAR